MVKALAGLADTPDDVPGLDADLQKVARLAADRITGIAYAAISRRPGDGCCTVAVGGDLVQTVEEASGAAGEEKAPRHTGDAAATTTAWPGFREKAADWGLGMVSVPLFTGSGATIATLDLYGRDAAVMAPLTAGICAAYDPDLWWLDESGDGPSMDSGGAELVAGFAEALSVRSTIQLALTLIGKGERVDARCAYLTLRMRAAGEGVLLRSAASAVIASSLGNQSAGDTT
ncbi:hypothetical protein [Actinoplanes utahensis]|uniref:ANTAR domain-containing protein n=1 Tax=Actinoplanes utahensis TaxID=1869 RepID=A0A0A6UNZ3_ACTUT|nr:hypothetical protein [Actinoplanes utahensis]KHD77845.1 hypothetical protein MB27_08620 [Actinoplanes utahensis]